MKNIIVVSASADPTVQSVIVGLRRSIAEEGCGAESMRWNMLASEHSQGCASCSMDEQCSQADRVDMAVQRIKAADASVFLIDASAVSDASAWMPLLKGLQNEPVLVFKPRYLVLMTQTSAMLAAQMAGLIQDAAQKLQVGWSSITLMCTGSLEQCQAQAVALGGQWAKRLTSSAPG